MFLNALDDRTQTEFRIMQKREQEFERTVARAAPDAVDGGVQNIGAGDERFDGV